MREQRVIAHSPTPVHPIELDVVVRPSGRVLFAGTVADLRAFGALVTGDARLWSRLAEPEETGLEGARIELAVSTRRDAPSRTARVIARTGPIHEGERKVYGLAQSQGTADLVVVPAGVACASSHDRLHLLVCPDLTKRMAAMGLRARHAPLHYV